MPKYFFAYHGGSAPATEEQETAAMLAWGQWMDAHETALVDAGNPVGMSKTVLSDGSVIENGGSNPLTGYSILEAADIETALSIAKSSPILNDGGTVEVAPLMEI